MKDVIGRTQQREECVTGNDASWSKEASLLGWPVPEPCAAATRSRAVSRRGNLNFHWLTVAGQSMDWARHLVWELSLENNNWVGIGELVYGPTVGSR